MKTKKEKIKLARKRRPDVLLVTTIIINKQAAIQQASRQEDHDLDGCKKKKTKQNELAYTQLQMNQ